MDNQYPQQTSPSLQPPIPPQNINPVPPPQQSLYGKRGWLKWALSLILVAIVSSGATYLVLKSQTSKQSPQIAQTFPASFPSSQAAPSPTPTPYFYTEGTRSATTNWKTYVNNSKKYSLKYPINWQVIENNNEQDIVDFGDPLIMSAIGGMLPLVTVETKVFNSPISDLVQGLEGVNIVIDGIAGKFITHGGCQSGSCHDVIFQKGNAFFRVSMNQGDPNYLKIFDQIVSNIKFIN